MGVDFLRRVAPSFKKGIDRSRIRLGTPTLFTQQPTSSPRCYAARVCPGGIAAVGETLCIHLEGDKIQALRGLDPVATIENPPSELFDALVACGGEAAGVVQLVHHIAGVAEMTIC